MAGSGPGTGTTAGIVLAGGRSSRMGASKAALEWHGSTLLGRAVRMLARTVDGPVVVVAAPGQDLPPVPGGVEVVADPVEGVGPLQGVATGLAAVGDRSAAAFVCSVDLPFLHPAFVRHVVAARGGADVALPFAHGFRQPLAAAYRTGLADLVADLVARGRSRPGMLYEHCTVVGLTDADLLADAALARLDPHLDSVENVNTPDEYAAARFRPAPEVVVRCYGALAGTGRRGALPVRAATLAVAAAAVGLALDRHVVAALDGDRITRDPELPLAAGDAVAFLSADAGG